MYDLIFFLGSNYPGWLLWGMMVFATCIGLFAAFMIGSVRWWYAKKTRLPSLWKEARKSYEEEIARLKVENIELAKRLSRAETVAHGTLIMRFEEAIRK
jgi:hypothetical protein